MIVSAEPAEVWSRLSDIERWPDWNPACVSTQVSAPLMTGQRLRLEMRLPRGRTFWTTPVLTELVAFQRIAWETRAMGMRAPTVTTLEPDAAGTLVTLVSESRGPFGFSYRLTFPEKTQAQMWSGALTGLARSFDDEERAPE